MELEALTKRGGGGKGVEVMAGVEALGGAVLEGKLGGILGLEFFCGKMPPLGNGETLGVGGGRLVGGIWGGLLDIGGFGDVLTEDGVMGLSAGDAGFVGVAEGAGGSAGIDEAGVTMRVGGGSWESLNRICESATLEFS